MMRIHRQASALAIIFLASPVIAQSPLGGPRFQEVQRPVIAVASDAKRQEPDIDMYASMSGRCVTLRVAGREFACRSVAYFHGLQGRANFSVVLDDPADSSHVISFSGENARRDQENLYELPVDRMLLNSKDRPRMDGLPVPSVELSSGKCRQLGNFATRQLSSISCTAIDRNGNNYELQFESDGSPMTVRRIREAPLPQEGRRAKETEQLECRHRAAAARVLPRDRTAYLLRCLEQDSPKPATAQQ